MADGKLRIAVVGAGIAGLTAAIALQKHEHIDVQIYERTAELREVGATIALGPNGLRTLDRLGVHNALDDSIAFRNKSGQSMIYKHYQTNETISFDVHKGDVEYRHRTARFYRPHLQKALLSHVSPSRLHLGKAFQSLTKNPLTSDLTITFQDGTTAVADVVLGADGIHSPVRRAFVPTSSTQWTGYSTFRSVFPRSHVAHIEGLPDEAIHIWSSDRQLFISPLAQDLFAVVSSHQSDPDAPDAPYKDATWNSDGNVDLLREIHKDWSPLVRAVIDATPYTRVYPNTAARELETWVLGDGHVTLAGDAAHAHGGAFAAGGSLAIDDAWAFATSILHVFPDGRTAADDKSVARALRLYEQTRKSHTDRVQKTVQSRNRGLVDRILSPESDEQLRVRMKSREDLSWIHEHDVQGAFARASGAENSFAEGPRL
ncbi:salicylate 1-monooxygenase [Plectosphaerella plurivora]|uniref:Salicylate 1-monooxygenase n=1 Tax=Plectosphaerella plurivora TaxID=936078 RepID=A0A9P8VID1_9PEZI|nr:salicylate 1-monooxygenase [Plectosphaerella plurivora]